jgi:hypothetical protein
MTPEVGDLGFMIAGQLEHLDRPVAAAGRKTPPVIIKLDVMHHVMMPRLKGRGRCHAVRPRSRELVRSTGAGNVYNSWPD